MTKEQAIDFLHFTKVRLHDTNESYDVQRKAFEIGYKWSSGASEPTNLAYPFIGFDKEKGMYCDWDMQRYELADEWYGRKEITTEEILAITIEDKLKPTHRPFKNAEECWNEMLRHLPFGWVIDKETDSKHSIVGLVDLAGYNAESSSFSFGWDVALRRLTFADGAPFGIKEE